MLSQIKWSTKGDDGKNDDKQEWPAAASPSSPLGLIQFRVAKALSTSSAKRTIPCQLLRDTRAGERLKVDPNQQWRLSHMRHHLVSSFVGCALLIVISIILREIAQQNVMNDVRNERAARCLLLSSPAIVHHRYVTVWAKLLWSAEWSGWGIKGLFACHS